MVFKIGHRVQEKYRPHRIGTVIKAEHICRDPKDIQSSCKEFYIIKIKGGGIQVTNGKSFKYLSNHEYEEIKNKMAYGKKESQRVNSL